MARSGDRRTPQSGTRRSARLRAAAEKGIPRSPLPFEVASFIARLVRDAHGQRDLISLANASRAWRKAALPVVWEAVTIDGSTAETWQRAVRQSQFLLASDQHLRMIRHLSLVGDEGDGLATLFQQILRRIVPQLRSLDMQGHRVDLPEVFLLQCAARLSHLRVGPQRDCLAVRVPFAMKHRRSEYADWLEHIVRGWITEGSLSHADLPHLQPAGQTYELTCQHLSSVLLCGTAKPASLTITAAGTELLARSAARGDACDLKGLVHLTISSCVCTAGVHISPGTLPSLLPTLPMLSTLIIMSRGLLLQSYDQLVSALAAVGGTLTRLHLDSLILPGYPLEITRRLIEYDGFLRGLSHCLPKLIALDLVFTHIECILLSDQVDSPTGPVLFGDALRDFRHLTHFGSNVLVSSDPRDLDFLGLFTSLSRRRLIQTQIEPSAEAAAAAPTTLVDPVGLSCEIAAATLTSLLTPCPTLRTFALPANDEMDKSRRAARLVRAPRPVASRVVVQADEDAMECDDEADEAPAAVPPRVCHPRDDVSLAEIPYPIEVKILTAEVLEEVVVWSGDVIVG